MKVFFDFLPVILFFIAYKFGGGTYQWGGESHEIGGIYVATAVMIVASLLQVILTWFFTKKVEKSHLITLVLVLILGGATLWLQNPNFIKWKPTVVNWLFATGFFLVPLFSKQTLLEKMMREQITLPKPVWKNLNIAWIFFFIGSGLANLYVAFNYPEATWVNFKLFGLMGLTILFVIAQSLYISKYIEEDEEAK